MDAVGPLVERLPLDRDRISECNNCVFVCPRPPDLSKRYKLAPDLAAIGQRPVIIDGDVGDANALHDYCMLALPRQIEHQGFRR